MLKVLIIKEIKNIVQSPKFIATFITAFVLIILSIILGIIDFQSYTDQYYTGINLSTQELQERTSWAGSSVLAYRSPNPMQIFISGINNDIGRLSNISSYSDIKLQQSSYSDDPIFAVFRFIDFAFIVQVVLSLIAILFTYNAINGERENGTLKLIFSNSIPKVKYLVAKWIGAWVGLLVPVIIPVLIGILIILFFNVPFRPSHWLNLLFFMFLSLTYFTFFITFGLLISSVTRESSNSFLVLLVCWICFVLIIPKLGTMASAQIISVPGVAEIEAQKSAIENELWENHEKELAEKWQQRNVETQDMTQSERAQYQDENMWNWMQEDDASRKKVQKEISEYGRKMNEDLRNKKIQQEKLGFMFSRLSPSSSYQLASMNLSETDIGLKHRYEQSMQEYKNQFTTFIDKKQKESGQPQGMQIMIDSERGLSVKTPDLKKTINISDMPHFKQPKQSFSEVFNASVIDVGLLIIYTLISFVLSLFFFIKYDVR